jgi:hypothetical protein
MDVTEVVETFVDGEAVEPAALMAALSEPEGRQLLVDLLVLRGLVLGHDAPRHLAVATAAPQKTSRWRLLSMAAGLAAVSIASGYVVGARNAPTAVVTEVPSAPATARGGSTATAVTAAPAPTQVIRLSNGVDWTERAGGN